MRLALLSSIGACRPVWVPRQDLASPHLMCNSEKRILYLHITLYMYICVCISMHMLATCIYMGVFMSGSRDMSTHDSK